jgi:hypothetical protein
LRVTIRVLCSVLLALSAHTVIHGLSVAGASAEAVILLLLLAAAGLSRQGRQLSPEPVAIRAVELAKHDGDGEYESA